MDQRLEMNVFGRVQGVGFRSFVFDLANKYELKGYARNTVDNSVEIVVEGNPKNIINFVKQVESKKGFIRIEEVKKSFWPVTNEFSDFKITG